MPGRRCPYLMDGAADVAGATYIPFQSELEVYAGAAERQAGEAHSPDPRLALVATFSYHGLVTDCDGEMLELEADQLRHAEIENAIRELMYRLARLNHMPSGRHLPAQRSLAGGTC